jgi:peptide/nickel transport system ATP-binding protein
VRRKECLGLLGSSGSGKSTLARIILGDLRASSGSVRVGTYRGSPASPPPGIFGVIYQDPISSLDRLWSVERCIAEPLVASGIAASERASRVRQLLSSVRMDHIDPRCRVTRLSVGQAQRVALARALAAKPQAVVADEPTSALDPTTAASIVRLLRQAAEDGAAVLVVSHNEPLLRAFCHRVESMRSLAPAAQQS